jgi:hypothetical protein
LLLERLVAKKQHLEIAAACFIGAEAAQGLDHAHRKRDEAGNPLGIVHRDVSPQEIQMIEAWIAGGARNAEGVVAEAPIGAKVRLHGTLVARWRLDGLNLDVGGNTRIHKSPDAGDYVEVRGRIDSNGRVIVERVRTRDDDN